MSEIFLSLRFSEAMEEAETLKRALEEAGASVFLCAVAPGHDILDEIVTALAGCELVVILGTETYGRKTDARFSTHDELVYILDEKKPFFLIKMCKRFAEPKTRFQLTSSVAFQEWRPGTTLPLKLTENIMMQLKKIKTGDNWSTPGGHGPSITPSKIQFPKKPALETVSKSVKDKPMSSHESDATRILNDEDFKRMLKEKVSDNEELKSKIRSIRDNSCGASLSLNNNRISEQGGEALAEALKSNSTLTRLDLKFNSISDQGGVALAEALKSNSTLTELILYDNNISDRSAAALAEALKSNCTLTWLNLSSNRISDKGGVALAEALKSNFALTKLGLHDNCISDQGGVALAEALRTNPTLTELDLNNNSISEQGCIALAEALKSNSTLNELDLSFNDISDQGCVAFAKALPFNPSLTKLYLYNNSISDQGGVALAEAFKSNSSLATLNLWGNNISKTVQKQIQNASASCAVYV